MMDGSAHFSRKWSGLFGKHPMDFLLDHPLCYLGDDFLNHFLKGFLYMFLHNLLKLRC